MNFFHRFAELLKPPHKDVAVATAPSKVILTQSCIDALVVGLRASRERQHEGVAYVLGRTDGVVALGAAVFVPDARTSRGSFEVSPRAMAAVISAAGLHELQVIAQVHTHPGNAFHSDGDVEGAKIRYPGFVSMVLPRFGEGLPSIAGAAVFLWEQAGAWRQLNESDVIVIKDDVPWTRLSTPTP